MELRGEFGERDPDGYRYAVLMVLNYRTRKCEKERMCYHSFPCVQFLLNSTEPIILNHKTHPSWAIHVTQSSPVIDKTLQYK